MRTSLSGGGSRERCICMVDFDFVWSVMLTEANSAST
jgi:hypothetical protein